MIRSLLLPAAVAAGVVVGLVAPAHARVHHRHHYRYARGVPPLPPSQSPIPPRLDGYAAGVFEVGIPGASSADPYDRSDLFRPGIGYIAPGE